MELHDDARLRRRLLVGATTAVLLAALAAIALPVKAGEVYGSGGVPGLTIGWSQPISETFGLRADLTGLSLSRSGRDNGMDYQAKASVVRLGLFADCFPFQSWGFRLTGGLTLNDVTGDAALQGTGAFVNLSGRSYLLTPADRMQVSARFPGAMPYVGIGWGHHASTKEWGLVVDIGASLGRGQVTGTSTGPILSTPPAQQDFRDQLDKWSSEFRFLPQLSIGLSYAY